MTEKLWLACADPRAMLDFLEDTGSERKLRLYACACVRRRWAQLSDERSRRAVEVAERYADGLADDEERRDAAVASHRAKRVGEGALSPAEAAAYTVHRDSDFAARRAGHPSPVLIRFGGDEFPAQAHAHAGLLRCIFGNPFRPVSLDRAWRTPDVLTLSQGAYEQRTLPAGTLDPHRLALLADALEEAGCARTDLLAHLRSPGPHVRGCWCVDLLLGKR